MSNNCTTCGNHSENLQKGRCDTCHGSFIELLVKACPRCGNASKNKSNPSGRCSSCLKKLKTAKHTPGHYLRAHMKADDALRRQDGKNGTASKKSSGRGDRKSIVKQTQNAEKRTGQKLSPDRKDNGKGYASSNTRMVPEKLNRGRHKVDGKKLAAWRKRLKKNLEDNQISDADKYINKLLNNETIEHLKKINISPEEFISLLFVKVKNDNYKKSKNTKQ